MSSLYPFTTVLEIMKPCKIDKKKDSHVDRYEQILNGVGGYSFEEKLDGIRSLCINYRNFSTKISKVTGAPGEKTEHVALWIGKDLAKLRELGPKLILDGELYLPGRKSNHVTSITNASADKAIYQQQMEEPLQYWVYDILRDVDGTWLVTKPWKERRARLEQLFAMVDMQYVILNPINWSGDYEGTLREILARGGEGGVLKDPNGTYLPGKRPMWNWIKVKQELSDDVVITGFMPPTKEYTGTQYENWPYWEDGIPVTKYHAEGLIGAIKIGKYNASGILVELGTVSGMDEATRRDMSLRQNHYIGQVIKIEAMEKSIHGVYRHAFFVEMHPDKNAHECKLEEND